MAQFSRNLATSCPHCLTWAFDFVEFAVGAVVAVELVPMRQMQPLCLSQAEVAIEFPLCFLF